MGARGVGTTEGVGQGGPLGAGGVLGVGPRGLGASDQTPSPDWGTPQPAPLHPRLTQALVLDGTACPERPPRGSLDCWQKPPVWGGGGLEGWVRCGGPGGGQVLHAGGHPWRGGWSLQCASVGAAGTHLRGLHSWRGEGQRWCPLPAAQWLSLPPGPQPPFNRDTRVWPEGLLRWARPSWMVLTSLSPRHLLLAQLGGKPWDWAPGGPGVWPR